MQTQCVTYTSASLCLQESWLVTYTLALGGSDSLHRHLRPPKTEVSSLPAHHPPGGNAVIPVQLSGVRTKKGVSKQEWLPNPNIV